MFCNRCGHRNPTGVNFCSSCGAPLSEGPDQTVAFLPDEPATESNEEDLGITPGELAEGTGVLVVRRGPDAGARFLLGAGVTHAGRHPDSEIFLDDITVSRRHAEFEPVEGGYRVRDVGSLNGTYVNRARIDEVILDSGDEVQIGKFKLVFLTARA